MKSKSFLCATLAATLISGCATFQRSGLPEDPEAPAVLVEQHEDSSAEVKENIEKAYVSQYGDIDLSINPMVEKWLDYFQGKGRRHMEKYLARSSRYLPMMKNTLRENGLPEDLVYVALIESGFSPYAHSYASAVGYWQFIRGTGKHYGLRINGHVDERRDPVLSTRAAASYFKALYNLFGNWHLALASYNTGENRVKRMVMKHYTRDFWTLVDKRALPRETRNYVPKFIAATLIAKNPEKFGFTKVDYAPPLSYQTVEIEKPISLAKLARHMNVAEKDLKILNPRYRSDYVPVYRGGDTVVRVPEGMQEMAVAAVEKSHVKAISTLAYYRVRRGDTLSEIAEKFGTRVSTLRQLNGIRRSFIRVGQRLKVPSRGAAGEFAAAPAVHVVRRGENLSVIAQRYGTTVSHLRRLNGLGRRSMIYVGQRLKVRDDESSSAQKTSYHVVRRGENLTLIARKYGTSVSNLQSLNGLTRGSVLYVGKKLKVDGQASRVHVVRRGETLIHIARHYDVPLRQLVSANDLKDRSMIVAGKRLVIP